MLTCSGLTGAGIAELWAQVVRHQEETDLEAKRRRQQVEWTWSLVQDRLLTLLHQRAAPIAAEIERQVLDGTLTPSLAADRLLAAFEGNAEQP